MDAFYGEIRAFPYYFTPQDWLACDGSVFLNSQYPTLQSVINYIYGGDGSTRFAVPNLIGSVLAGTGQGSGLQQEYDLGVKVGDSTVTLSATRLPAHNHTMEGLVGSGSTTMTNSPNSTVQLSRLVNITSPVALGVRTYVASALAGTLVPMNPQAIAATGAGTNHANEQPYLTLNYCICAYGDVYPSPPS